MNYKSHLIIAWATVSITSVLSYNNVFDIYSILNPLSYIFNYVWAIEKSNYVFSSNDFIILAIVYLFSNLLNDLDNPKSKIGRLFFFISIPAWVLSVILYRILYPKSFNWIYNSFGWGLWWWLKTTSVVHRVVFHSEIWLAFLLFFTLIWSIMIGLSDITRFTLLAWITLGYLTHIVCDAISWKVPYPITVRLVFIALWIKKETFGLKLSIWK